MSKATWIKVNGTWKKATCVWIKENGIWKSKVTPKGNINNGWKEFIEYTLKKNLEYQFNETTNSSRSNTFTLDNLISVDEITVDNGNATYSISGNKVTVNVSGGNSRNEYDPTKYSKSVSDYKTSSADSFQSSMNYNADGYAGTLNKDGSSYVSSGSYTPSSSKTITDYRTSSSNSFSSSVNKDGYTLEKYGNSYVYSGSYTPTHSKEVEKWVSVTAPAYLTWSNGSWTYYIQYVGKTYNYSDNEGYKGLLELNILYGGQKNNWGIWKNQNPDSEIKSWMENNKGNYEGEKRTLDGGGDICGKGTVTRPASDNRVYRQDYKKVINISSSDTRVWKQNYKGYVYKGGYDYYYQYKINMKYTIKN